MNLFPHVRVVLIETTHPGNIGAAARAIKNMGLSGLYLVNPQSFPHEKAIWRSASADDVVKGAVVCATVEEAIADCSLVIGTSARERRIPWPLLDPKQCAAKVNAEMAPDCQVAILFGRESRGLTNEELQMCHFHVNIPTGEAYSSLNIAMAVQVIAYEILCASSPKGSSPQAGSPQNSSANRPELTPELHKDENQENQENQDKLEKWDMPLATSKDIEFLFEHLEKTLTEIKFHDPENPRQLMVRLRRLFNRIRPDQMEINILRGILTAVDQLAQKEK